MSAAESRTDERALETFMWNVQLISKYVPISTWLPQCLGKNARADIVAGITLAGLLVPQALVYADIAGRPPQTGLYPSCLALVMKRKMDIFQIPAHRIDRLQCFLWMHWILMCSRELLLPGRSSNGTRIEGRMFPPSSRIKLVVPSHRSHQTSRSIPPAMTSARHYSFVVAPLPSSARFCTPIVLKVAS